MGEERTCKECGWRIEPDTRVCDNCGATQSEPESNAAGQYGGQRGESSQEVPESFQRIFKIVFFVIVAVTILISLAIAVVIGWALFASDSGDASPGQESPAAATETYWEALDTEDIERMDAVTAGDPVIIDENFPVSQVNVSVQEVNVVDETDESATVDIWVRIRFDQGTQLHRYRHTLTVDDGNWVLTGTEEEEPVDSPPSALRSPNR